MSRYETVSDVLSCLDLAPVQSAAPLDLVVGPTSVRILCGAPLRAELAAYFDAAIGPVQTPDFTVQVLEGQALDPAPMWHDWAREPGKTGRKDAIWDLADGRLVHKIRTGVTFLQSTQSLVAWGATTAHANQVVNFINTQVLNHGQRNGWQICHAAAVVKQDRMLAIAGLSGGGKSTSVLRMMNFDGVSFVTNDRLLVRSPDAPPAGQYVAQQTAQGLGIPKHPRINPGTILGNPRLTGMLSDTRTAELLSLPEQDLWQLEEKYDLIIPEIYGAGRIQYAGPLTDFWVLNWQHNADQATMIEAVDLRARPDLLGAIMKSPGPFYQHPDGHFLRAQDTPDPEAYLQVLQHVQVQEVTGRVDFDAIANFGSELLCD